MTISTISQIILKLAISTGPNARSLVTRLNKHKRKPFIAGIIRSRDEELLRKFDLGLTFTGEGLVNNFR